MLETLKFDANGLIPAIVQDAQNGAVLMQAYMNKESLSVSIEEGFTCFWSRSRQTLWRKGETSGHVQKIVSIAADCDEDSLLIRVLPKGPACHTGQTSCYFNNLVPAEDTTPEFSIDSLYELMKDRKAVRQEGSYTTYLFEKGDDKILKKIGEECTEVVIAAKNNDNAETIYEVADLAYHTLVLLVQKGITLQQIRSELASRHVIDHKIKQEHM